MMCMLASACSRREKGSHDFPKGVLLWFYVIMLHKDHNCIPLLDVKWRSYIVQEELL